jgi:FkbH-like protein
VASQPDPQSAQQLLEIARYYLAENRPVEALRWAASVIDAGDDFPSWLAAARLIEAARRQGAVEAKRRVRVGLVGSFTTSQLTAILPLAALRQGIELQVWEGGYGQYRQEILNPDSALYRSQPDFVVIAAHEGALALPLVSSAPGEHVECEAARWVALWESIRRHSSARIVQLNFASPSEAPLGHLGTRLRGSRHAMIQAVNAALGLAAGTDVDVVDCERLSALVGKEQWIDPRYWHLSKQAVSLQALPLLARHLVAVMTARIGLSRKCLVVDLDNTLWGGVVGEDGVTGITLGGDATGEAFLAFQSYILQLKEKGVILAVCSKNNEEDARAPFQTHPEMRLKLDDFAAFAANWEPKPENLVRIARTLNIGLDAMVFVDDNPAECTAVRRALPEVDVIALPADPAYYVRTLSRYLNFETATLTEEDERRSHQYQALAHAEQMKQEAGSLEEMWEALDMHATIAPFDEMSLPRILQLIGKTNQFNLTTRRHGPSQVEAFMRNPACVHFSVRLRDRYGDHGLVAIMIAVQSACVFEIDTWLMSCRVIGRTLEKTMMAHLCCEVMARGATGLRGFYSPSAKNELVKDLYSQLGFEPAGAVEGTCVWEYDLSKNRPIENRYIRQHVNRAPNATDS